ncbi:AraC family transcriptional regulator [Paenibacillus sp. B01]|uniref:AraC family transcriptional regulator n=1 Tax=Paenibacillus sp. B01 TaxID=2660554 RepID=UPI001890DD3D|nr:AraC family transcriptional regulator [Paenibacillus sp. B01]
MFRTGSLFDPAVRRGGCEPEVTAYYFKKWQGYAMDYHRHDATEIMYVMEGGCLVETEPGTPMEPGSAASRLKRGDLVLLDANVPHRLLVREECRMLNVEFRFVAAAAPLAEAAALAEADAPLAEWLSRKAPSLVLRDSRERALQTLRQLVLELDESGIGGSAMSRLLHAQLLLRLSRLETAHAAERPQDGYVEQAKRYMAERLDQPLQAEQVAAAVRLHPGYLQRIFRQAEGVTLGGYLSAIRLEKARQLLRHSSIPVSDLWDYVGLGSRAYFHAWFRRQTGMTPSEFRRSVTADSRPDSAYSPGQGSDFEQ